MSVNICVFGSGSKGNCTAIWTENTVLLIDAGKLAVRYIKSCLSKVGLNASKMDAVLITHCHTDHLSDTTYRLCSPENTPLYCSESTWSAALKRRSNRRLEELEKQKLVRELPGEEFRIGDFVVRPFEVSHSHRFSAGKPVGYTLQAGNLKVAYATDLGHVTDSIVEELADSNTLILESNHDVEMELNSGRHPETIEWVLSGTGHLSNDQCAETISNLIAVGEHPPQHIILAHLSAECNRPELALSSAASAIGFSTQRKVNLIAANQKMPTPLLSITVQ